jgi:hypothetical protein
VARLLDFESDALAEFVTCLEDLAKDQGWEQRLAECKKLAFVRWEGARAVRVRAGGDQHVVVLLKSWTHCIPGSDTQTAILLDANGGYLDHLGCEINARLTRMDSGRHHVVIPAEPEADGAQLVIRLDGVSARGNFAHSVYHGGAAQYYWGQDDLPPDRPTTWDAKGLCRAAIRGGRFVVVFPGERSEL